MCLDSLWAISCDIPDKRHDLQVSDKAARLLLFRSLVVRYGLFIIGLNGFDLAKTEEDRGAQTRDDQRVDLGIIGKNQAEKAHDRDDRSDDDADIENRFLQEAGRHRGNVHLKYLSSRPLKALP